MIVTEDENGLSASDGSDTVGVSRGRKVTAAAKPPNSVAEAKTMATTEIRDLLFTASFGFLGALGIFGPLFDIKTSRYNHDRGSRSYESRNIRRELRALGHHGGLRTRPAKGKSV